MEIVIIIKAVIIKDIMIHKCGCLKKDNMHFHVYVLI